MGSKWKELTIDELKAPVKSSIAMGPFGSRIKAENFVDSGVPILKGGNLHKAFITDEKFDYLTVEKAEELKTSQAIRKDLVITHRGTIGQVSIIPDNSKYEKYIVSQSQLKVTLNQDLVNPYYVNYFFRSRLGQHRLLANSSQVGVPAIAKASSSVKNILVPCPTLNEQNKIVEVLSSLDNKIELNQQTNQTLENMSQALFKSWFVDFDPVFDNLLAKADFKLENLDSTLPEELVKKAKIRLLALNGLAQAEQTKTSLKALAQGLSPQSPEILTQHATTHVHFPSEFEHNEQLGWIPKGWKDGTLACIADALSGYAFKSKDFSEEGCAVIKIKNISSDRTVGIYDVNRVPQSIATTADRFLLTDGDIVMAMTGATVGKFGVIAIESSEPYYLNQRVCKLSPKNKNGSAFLFSALNKPGVEECIVSAAQGSAQPNISATGILSMKFLVPTIELIELFNSLMMVNFERKIRLRKENYILTKLRDTLLPKLISGELQIPDVKASEEKTI